MPSSIALPTTRRDAAKSMRPPKLLPPRPTTDTSSVEPPSLRFFIGGSFHCARASPRIFRASSGGALSRPNPRAMLTMRSTRTALFLANWRDIGIVLVADAHVSAERDRERENRPLLLRVHDARVPDAILRKIIDHEL